MLNFILTFFRICRIIVGLTIRVTSDQRLTALIFFENDQFLTEFLFLSESRLDRILSWPQPGLNELVWLWSLLARSSPMSKNSWKCPCYNRKASSKHFIAHFTLTLINIPTTEYSKTVTLEYSVRYADMMCTRLIKSILSRLTVTLQKSHFVL